MTVRTDPQDDVWLTRALSLAIRGRGRVEPNPMVGCVIVKDDRAIGEGYHQRFGGPHAEPNALAACTESPAGATAYVSLEPCCHTNKQTPPCAPRLIDAKLARVVIGALDPNPQVAGRGAEQLRSAGIRVDVVDSPHARQLIAPFVATMIHHRPYVTLKWAQTADGKVAASPGKPRLLISNAASNRIVHELRARSDAILVGFNTVLADDPILNVRDVEPLRPLRRVVLDRNLATPLASRLVRSATESPVELICSQSTYERLPDRVSSFTSHGITVTALPLAEGGRIDLESFLQHLGSCAVTHLIVEPGPRMARRFIAENRADRVWVFHSPNRVDDPNALDAPQCDYPITGRASMDGDTLTESLNPASDVFFASDSSADFRLLALPPE